MIFYIRLISNNTGFSWQKQLKNNKICVIIFIKLLITNHIFPGGLISCTIHSHNKNLNLTLTDTTAKIIHTYGVVKQAEELAGRMHLSAEDTDLARLIALLHDIGRFEQLKRYDSFEPGTMDHAAYGVKVLFDEGMIRRFLPDDKWDSIIYTAIAHHSDYELPEISDPQTLLHAKLIRDEDKLDNCRVKLVDSTSTFINVSEEELGTQSITQKVYETVFKNKCILSADRVTQMDYWVSYIVYFFDINFKESFDIIAENDYLNRIIDRISYSNPVTKEQMENIRVYMQNFINSHTNSQSF